MTIGMLWYDNSNRPLADKVLAAADYYRKKYGRTPDCAYVNPRETLSPIPGIELSVSRQVLPHHIWIGVKDHD